MAQTFEEYVVQRLPALLGLAGALSGNRHTAEDVVQEVLLRASERWAHIARADSPDAYVRRMVVNEYRSWRRKWARILPRADLVIDATEPDPAVRQAEFDKMTKTLARLSAKQRTALVLRFYEGLADADIATVMCCSPATVRSHTSRALKRLKIDLTSSPSETPVHSVRKEH